MKLTKIAATVVLIGISILCVLTCTKNPEAPVRDNPYRDFKLTASLSSDGVVLNWGAATVSGLASYIIHRSSIADSGFASIGTTTNAILTYTDTVFYHDSTYYYKVSALSGNTNVDSIKISDASLCISDTMITVPDIGMTTPVINIINCSNPGIITWTASESIDWLSLSSASGTSEAGFTIVADSNLTGSERSGVVTVTSDGVAGSPKAATVTQETVGASLCVSETSWMSADGGETSQSLEVTNCGNAVSIGWSVAADSSWLSVSPGSGTTPGGFTVTTSENASGVTRTGTVTISSSGVSGSPKTVTVTQGTVGASLCISEISWASPNVGGTSGTIDVTNCGNAASISWSAAADSSWLSVSPGSGTTPGSFSITASENTSGATRTGTVTVSSDGVHGSQKTVAVTQGTVGASLCVSETSWSSPDAGGTSASIDVTNCGNVLLISWSATPDSSWLSVSPGSGTNPGSFSITASENTSGTTRTGTVTVSSDGVHGSPKTVAVTQGTVGASLCVLETSWTSPNTGGTSASIDVTNCGNASSISWSVAADSSWLSVSPGSGTTPGSFSIIASENTSGTTRIGNVTITSPGVDGSPKTVAVTQSTVAASLCVSETEWSSPDAGGTSGSIDVTNCGNASSINWGAAADSSWLEVSQSSGTTPGSFSIVATENASGSIRTGTVTITSVGVDGSPRLVTVSQGSLPVLCVSETEWHAYHGGETNSIDVTNCGNASSFDWSVATDSSWLSVTPGSGTTPSSFAITVSAAILCYPSRQATVTVTATGVFGSPRTILVTQENPPPPPDPVLCVSRTEWITSYEGGTISIDVINYSDDSPLDWSVVADSSWLSVTPGSGTTPSSFAITASAASVGVPTRQATVTVTASGVIGSPRTILVTQVMPPDPPVRIWRPSDLVDPTRRK